MGNQANVVRPKGLAEGRPAPEFRELNAKGNFGSASKDVLKTSNRIMGGASVMSKVEGTSAKTHGMKGSPSHMPVMSGGSSKSGSIASKVASSSIKHRSTSMIGWPGQKKL